MMLRVLAIVGLLLAGGCLDPIVGAECGESYDDCGGTCVDLATDENNCGMCGMACPGGPRGSGRHAVAGGAPGASGSTPGGHS